MLCLGEEEKPKNLKIKTISQNTQNSEVSGLFLLMVNFVLKINFAYNHIHIKISEYQPINTIFRVSHI